MRRAAGAPPALSVPTSAICTRGVLKLRDFSPSSRLHVVTGHIVRTAAIAQGWGDLTAYLGGQGTTAIQPAPRRGINRCRQFTMQDESWWRLVRIRLGHSGEERLGVGVLRMPKNLLHCPHFDDLPNVHHCHTIADMPNHAEVMRDEEIG